MTFAARPHQPAAGGGPVSLGTIRIEDYTFPDSAGATFNTDGTISINQYLISGPSSWFTPTTAGIGSSYQIRFTLLTGNAWDAGLTSGTLYALSSARTLTWSSSTVDKEATVGVEILTLAGVVAITATLSIGLYQEP